LLNRVRMVVPADRIDASLVGAIEAWTTRHPGGVGLSIDIAAPEGSVQFVSRTRRIGLSDEALEELEGFAGPAGIECRFEWNRIAGG